MSKRRGHGEGSIFQRRDGRWVGQIDLGWEEGRRQRKQVYGSTEREVIDRLRELRTTKAMGLPIAEERLTVEQWLSSWLKDHQPLDQSPNTFANYEWIVRCHLVPALGRKRLRNLTVADVNKLLHQRAQSGLSRSSVIRMRLVLASALRAAETEGILARNVAALALVPRLPTSDGRSLTVDEAQRLLDEVRVDRLGAAVTIMLTMGLRPGEALGLGWQHIDFDSDRLDVRRSLKREPGGLRLGDVKTKNSRRSLQMPQLVIDRLQAHRRAQNKERMAAAEWQDPDLVFPTTRGTLIDPRNFRRSFDKLTDRAGLGKWTPNELRHSAISLLSAAGVPIEEIADVVGHDGTRMTTGVYRHVLAPVVNAAAAPMDDLFR